MVWLYHSPIPVGRRGVIYLFKWFLPAVAGLEEGGAGRHPVDWIRIQQQAGSGSRFSEYGSGSVTLIPGSGFSEYGSGAPFCWYLGGGILELLRFSSISFTVFHWSALRVDCPWEIATENNQNITNFVHAVHTTSPKMQHRLWFRACNILGKFTVPIFCLWQCSGSMPLWRGSGSGDPCLWLMDADPEAQKHVDLVIRIRNTGLRIPVSPNYL